VSRTVKCALHCDAGQFSPAFTGVLAARSRCAVSKEKKTMKIRQIKPIQAFIVTFLLAILAAACSDDNAESGAAGASASAEDVAASCATFCLNETVARCPFLQLLGGSVECLNMYCDMTGRSAGCLKAYQTYFDCANNAAEICNDCDAEFSAVASCK
jgi:hypothetical protein